MTRRECQSVAVEIKRLEVSPVLMTMIEYYISDNKLSITQVCKPGTVITNKDHEDLAQSRDFQLCAARC